MMSNSKVNFVDYRPSLEIRDGHQDDHHEGHITEIGTIFRDGNIQISLTTYLEYHKNVSKKNVSLVHGKPLLPTRLECYHTQ